MGLLAPAESQEALDHSAQLLPVPGIGQMTPVAHGPTWKSLSASAQVAGSSRSCDPWQILMPSKAMIFSCLKSDA